jgi:hypothetical protein
MAEIVYTYDTPDPGLGANLNYTGTFAACSIVNFTISTTDTLFSYPLGPLGPLGSHWIGNEGDQHLPNISRGWQNPTTSSDGTIILEFDTQFTPPDNASEFTAGAGGQVNIDVPVPWNDGQTSQIVITGSLLCIGTTGGDDIYPPNTAVGAITIQGPSGPPMVWSQASLGSGTTTQIFDQFGLTLNYGSQTGTITLETSDAPDETISIVTPAVNFNTPVALAGTNYFRRASAMEYSLDGGNWTTVGSFAYGFNWTGTASPALTGTHTLQVRDKTFPSIVSNVVTYTINSLFLSEPTAYANTPIQISGPDLESALAIALQYQVNGAGDWLAVGGFVEASAPGAAWTGVGPTQPLGTYTLQVRNAAIPGNLSNTVTYSIASGGVLDIPFWPMQPDWQGGVLERLEWLTNILTADNGAEQRSMARLSPRRTFEVQYQLRGPERTLYDLIFKSLGSQNFYVPNWTDIVRIPNPIGGTNAFVPMVTAGHDYTPGQLVVLYASPFSYELAFIALVAENGLTLYAPTKNLWPAQTRLMPVYIAQNSDEPQATRQADRTVTVTVAFMTNQPMDFDSSVAGRDTFMGFPVLTDAPDETTDMTYQFQRIVNLLDPKVGLRLTVDSPGYAFSSQQFAWFFNGYAANANLRSLLYYLAGRLKPIWVPTFFSDLDLVYDIGANDTTLTIQRCGYSDYAKTTLQGRQSIRIELYDGTNYYRTISASAESGSQEVLEVLSLGVAIPRVLIRRISFIALCRQDVDTIEIQHTAAGGVCSITTTFREAPDIRALIYTILDLAKTSAGLVGQSGGSYRLSGTDGSGLSKSVSSQTAGQFYMEATLSFGSSGSGRGFGITTAATVQNDFDLGTPAAAAFMSTYTFYGSEILNNGAAVSNGAPATNGVMGMAVDLDANLIWFTGDGGATWNYDSSHSPATGVGGIDISSWRAAGVPVFFFVYLRATYGLYDSATVNSGQGNFVAVPPDTYTYGWPNP